MTGEARPRWRATQNYVWCDSHCEIHAAKDDVYDEGDLACFRPNWRAVAVRTTDPSEEF